MAGRVPGKGFWSPRRGPGFNRTFHVLPDGSVTPGTTPSIANDWQNPEPLRQPDRFWAQSPATLRAVISLPPGEQLFDRPLLAANPPALSWTFTLPIAVLTPKFFTGLPVSDWTVPPPQPPSLQSWTQNPPTLRAIVATPFNQFDWPSPRAPAPILQSWTLNLQQTALRPIPFNQDDWPLPKVAPRLEQTQDVSFPLTLIGQDAMLVGEQVTALPPQPTYPVDLRTALGRIPPSVVQAPFNQFDWPVPKAPPRLEQTLDVSFPLMLIGQDKLPVGLQVYDLPRGAFVSLYERRGLTWSYNLNLIGQDVLTVGEQITERPPLGPIQPLRSWTWNYLLTLIGKDRLPTGEQVTDLVPRPPFEPATRTWVWSYNLNLIGQDAFPTGEQVYTLPPVGPYYDVSLRTWITLVTSAGKPFAQYDWPVPKGYDFSVTLRSFIASFPPGLIGQDAMITGKQVTDRPQLAPIPPENVKTWIQTVNLALVTAPGTPFSQNDWPLPRRPERPERSWTGSFPLELIGQDFITAGKQVTDLAPRGTSPADLRSWIWYTALAISSPSAPVGVVVSALPPLPPQPQAVGQATAFPLSLIGQDALPVGKQLTDLAPRGILATDYRSWIQFTSLALNNSLGVPVGEQLFERTPRAAQPAVDLGTWISTVKLLLPVPFSQADWPTPRGPQLPQRSWISSPNLDLISAVQPFSQNDWPVPRGPQLPQRSFTASFPLELIGQDQFPPGRQVYDRTPPGYLFSQELRTVTHSPAVPPVVVVTAGGETLLMMGVG